MNTLFEDGNKKVMVGTVKKIADRNTNGTKKKVITLEDRTGNSIDIYFSNKKDSDKKITQLADRIEKSKVDVGTYMTAIVYENEDNGKNYATGVDFMVYSGLHTGLKTPKGTPVTFIMGTACNGQTPTDRNTGEPIDNQYRVSIAVNGFEKGKKTTKWYSVTFFDKSAEIARKLLNNKIPCVIRCGELKEYKADNGNVYYNVVGYGMDVKFG